LEKVDLGNQPLLLVTFRLIIDDVDVFLAQGLNQAVADATILDNFRVILIGCQSNILIRLGADEWIVLLLPMFRATSTSSGVSNAHLIILIEAI
jgi:hypothetical protein